MKAIAITGSKGTVGSAISEQLDGHYELIPIDLPEIDARQPEALAAAMTGASVVVHLAGVFGPPERGMENWRSPHQDPANRLLFRNVVRAAIGVGAHQFIHASSIHVEDTRKVLRESAQPLAAVPRVFRTKPVSGYGIAKRQQEAVLQRVAAYFPDGAVSLRLGGVRADNLPLRQHADAEVVAHEQRVWLAHEDLGRLVKNVVERPQPGYAVVNAVSANDGRLHDTSNVFGWHPSANSGDHLV